MSKERGVLRVFFAVTETSLYSVEYEDAVDGRLCMTKLAQRDNVVSRRPVGSKIEGWDSLFLVIRRACLQLCNGWEEDHHHSDYTSYLVALFLDEIKARECLQKSSDQSFDCRWLNQTRQVLQAIGNEHPGFRVSWNDIPSEFG